MVFSHNFSAGPGALPDCVLAQTREALATVPGAGVSILGVTHRSKWFRDVVDEAEEHFRQLLGLSSRYRVLFLQGGSTLQFSQIPMTLLRGRARHAEYLHTGYWSGKSIPEARREGEARVLWSGEDNGFRELPRAEELEHADGAAYFHYISNETVEGLQFHDVPGREDVLRICDMSSDFLSRPVETERFALMYAHAQKNLGPSGITVVVVRDDIVSATPEGLPAMMDYRRHVEAGSIYNTPPVFAIYVTMLVARWLRREIGGLAAMEAINRGKAERLYGAIDASGGFYRGRAAKENRSLMNVVFELERAELEAVFLREAEAEGFYGLEGHRSLSRGLRASLYNAVTPASVEALVGFMADFQQRRG